MKFLQPIAKGANWAWKHRREILEVGTMVAAAAKGAKDLLEKRAQKRPESPTEDTEITEEKSE